LPQETEKFFYCNPELKLFLHILLLTFCYDPEMEYAIDYKALFYNYYFFFLF